MNIKPVAEIGANRPFCTAIIHVAEGPPTYEAKRRAWHREQLGVPLDRCVKRADFMVDHAPRCRQHAQQAALAHVMQSRERSDEEEIARPRCGCPVDVVKRVILEHGTCSMGGCPYGGDI